MEPEEVAVFVSQITGTPVDEIPLDHPEVEKLSGLSTEDFVDYLCELSDQELIDKAFDGLGLSNVLWRRQKAAIRRMFEGGDGDGDGQLDKEELQGLLGGTELFSEEELESILADVEVGSHSCAPASNTDDS